MEIVDRNKKQKYIFKQFHVHVYLEMKNSVTEAYQSGEKEEQLQTK